MTTTETIRIDSLDHVPDNGDVVALEMTWAPNPARPEDEETRTLDLGRISPGDDRLAIAMTGKATFDAIGLAPPTRHMVVWFVAANQMKKRREPWQKLEHLFTMETLKRAKLEAVVEINHDDDPDDVPAGSALDDIDLDRNDLDPT